jgi:hypothetical protein
MDKKSILIGALGASLLFVILGAGTSYTTEKQNKFEFHVTENANQSGFIINTETGDAWYIIRRTRTLCEENKK